jgi:hypothetical protein
MVDDFIGKAEILQQPKDDVGMGVAEVMQN